MSLYTGNNLGIINIDANYKRNYIKSVLLKFILFYVYSRAQ